MIKFTGAALLFLFFSLLGIYMGEREKRRLKECEAFIELFEYIKNQVSYFLTPTKVMYRNFLHPLLEENGFLPALRSHENDDVYHDIWRSSLKSCESRMSLSNEQMKLIESFGDCIGKSYGRIQVEGFDYYICSLSKIIEKEKSEIDKNVKLYRTLGIAAGACAAILLI